MNNAGKLINRYWSMNVVVDMAEYRFHLPGRQPARGSSLSERNSAFARALEMEGVQSLVDASDCRLLFKVPFSRYGFQ